MFFSCAVGIKWYKFLKPVFEICEITLHSLGSDLSGVGRADKLGEYELEPTCSLISITFVKEGNFTTSYKEKRI